VISIPYAELCIRQRSLDLRWGRAERGRPPGRDEVGERIAVDVLDQPIGLARLDERNLIVIWSDPTTTDPAVRTAAALRGPGSGVRTCGNVGSRVVPVSRAACFAIG
jgi:hypothetical protein